ncbi:hypothetical protein [Streptomyces sp. NPDC056291]|uniref:hypothetical protein n=1 Tax=Streptomyces sp. NPDC056291 TaxID=3345772 RepID=UPI0035E24079
MPQPALAVTVAPGEVLEDWCPACKAYTRITGSLALLTPAGVSTVGTWTWCSVCEDPDDQEASRG